MKKYLVGSGFTSSINQLAGHVIQLNNQKVDIIHKEVREGEVRHSCVDITQAQEKLGYNPGYSLERGLFETYQWCGKDLNPSSTSGLEIPY